MKTFGKHLHLPGFHIDPIQRDLLVVLATGFLVAGALVSVGFIFFH